MPLGAALGLAAAVGVGFAIYWGGVRLDLRRFFRWTGVFILFVAAGLLAGALRAFHEAGLWNGLQAQPPSTPAVGCRRTVVLGTLLEGVFGYQAAPTVGEALVYVGVSRFLRWPCSGRRRGRRRRYGAPEFQTQLEEWFMSIKLHLAVALAVLPRRS